MGCLAERNLVFIYRKHDGNIDHILRHFSVSDTKEVTPVAGCKQGSLCETAEGSVGQKVSAWEHVGKIDTLSS
jgi:hypothetical protein